MVRIELQLSNFLGPFVTNGCIYFMVSFCVHILLKTSTSLGLVLTLYLLDFKTRVLPAIEILQNNSL